MTFARAERTAGIPVVCFDSAGLVQAKRRSTPDARPLTPASWSVIPLALDTTHWRECGLRRACGVPPERFSREPVLPGLHRPPAFFATDSTACGPRTAEFGIPQAVPHSELLS